MSIKIIAELAQGYEGNPRQTIELTKAALKTNCDIIKFQCLYADETAVPSYKHYKFFKKLEMDFKIWSQVNKMIKKQKKELMLNVSGFKSFKVARDLNLKSVKLHTTHFFFNDLIHEIKNEFQNLYFSIGGIHLNEIKNFIKKHNFDKKKFNNRINFTYGFQSSPTPIEKNNILKLKSYIKAFSGFNFGFEDHTSKNSELKLTTPLLALPLGIRHLEKHLTLKNKVIEDSESALTPNEFREFVFQVRTFEKALGDGNLKLSNEELKYRKNMLKVVIVNRKTKKFKKLKKEDVSLKRIKNSKKNCINEIEVVLGKKLKIEKNKFDPILEKDLL